MGLAVHRQLEGGGVASQVENELDVVYDGQGGDFDDHSGSVSRMGRVTSRCMVMVADEF